MIKVTTVQGGKDILNQYSGGEYCIIYASLLPGLLMAYYLVSIKELDKIEESEEYGQLKWLPFGRVQIPEFIMLELIEQGCAVKDMPEKERQVQEALGTAPEYRRYLIVEKEKGNKIK